MENRILDKINSPSDLKSLSKSDIPSLCDEIRHFLIDHVEKNGGHLASNLGVTELSVALISSSIGLDEDATEVYNNVKEGMKDVLAIKPTDYPDTEEGKEQYKEDLSKELDTTLKENGIELEPEIIDGIADYIDENVEIKDEYTDEEINDVILSYYDAYVKYLEENGGEPPAGMPEFPEGLPQIPGGMPEIPEN